MAGSGSCGGWGRSNSGGGEENVVSGVVEEDEREEVRSMVWFLELEMHWFYRLVSSTVGRQWRMVEVQVRCARVLGEGGTMLLTSSRSSGCGGVLKAGRERRVTAGVRAAVDDGHGGCGSRPGRGGCPLG